MLIGIDASRAVARFPTGTETYSRRLIQALLTASPHPIRLYFRSAADAGDFPNAELCLLRFPRLWTHLRLSWEMVRRPPDLLFVPAHVLPLVHPQSLVTVHDLGYLYFPRAHPFRQRLYLDLSTRWNCVAAAHLLADSAATRADLVARYGVPPEKVTVAHPGYDETLSPVRDADRIASLLARYGIASPYFLYLRTLQPRKNLSRLIAAFGRLIRRRGDPASLQLVIAGRPGWLYRDLFAQVQRERLEGSVLFVGYVPDEDKPPLLSGAVGVLFPSLYEGFGLPVLEAQACGCPVVCSNTSSLPEVAGEGALLVDPLDEGGLVRAMERLLEERNLREDLVEAGFENLRRFSWAGCARTVLDVIERLAGGGG